MGNAELLSLLIDKEVITILKKRLSPEQRADLVLELINPHRPLTTEQKAKLGGISPRAQLDREKRTIPAREKAPRAGSVSR